MFEVICLPFRMRWGGEGWRFAHLFAFEFVFFLLHNTQLSTPARLRTFELDCSYWFTGERNGLGLLWFDCIILIGVMEGMFFRSSLLNLIKPICS